MNENVMIEMKTDLKILQRDLEEQKKVTEGMQRRYEDSLRHLHKLDEIEKEIESLKKIRYAIENFQSTSVPLYTERLESISREFQKTKDELSNKIEEQLDEVDKEYEEVLTKFEKELINSDERLVNLESKLNQFLIIASALGMLISFLMSLIDVKGILGG